MHTYRVTPAGLAYIAKQLAEITGQPHESTSPAVAAYAGDAEDSADANDAASAAQFEVRAMHTLSGRPEVVTLAPEHVECIPLADA